MDIIVRQLDSSENEKLKHIFSHRVFCREYDGFITQEKFPNGWIDSLDEISIHIVAEYNNEIIGSSRITIFNSYTMPSIFNSLFETIKFEEGIQVALFSKASVSPKYRNMGISTKMVNYRETICRQLNVKNIIAIVVEFQIDNYLRYGYSIIQEADIKDFINDLDLTLTYRLAVKRVGRND